MAIIKHKNKNDDVWKWKEVLTMKNEKTKAKKIKLFKFAVLGFFAATSLFALTGCEKKKENSKSGFIVDNQLALPQKGEQIAIMNVRNYGSIKIRLFEQAVPKTVKHFVDLAKAGKYNGLKFDEIVSDLKIQCSDENKAVEEQKPIVESNESLHNYNGAIGAVRTQNGDGAEGQNGQFYIIFSEDGKRADFDYLQQNRSEYIEGRVEENEAEFKYGEDVRNNYRQVGGFPAYDLMKANVFGQVYEGMDVVNKIADCPKDTGSEFDEPSPIEDIVIESVEIVNFDA